MKENNSINIYQWALATKTGDNLKEFLKNKEDEHTLWYLIFGLHPKHPAVIRWKTLREYMNEQERLFHEYEQNIVENYLKNTIKHY